jgi:hypothetical protein
VTDGVQLRDRNTGELIDTIRLDDSLRISEIGPGFNIPAYWFMPFGFTARDFFHTNSVHVRDGTLILSSLAMSSVIALDADPVSDGFGEILWTLSGQTSSPLAPSDLIDPSGDLAFNQQHHVQWTDDGRITLWDNISQPYSRGLRLDINEDEGTANIDSVWPVELPCRGQGSAFLMEDDHMLATCAQEFRIFEVDSEGEEAAMTRMVCPDASGASDFFLYRVEPVNLFP